MKVIVTGGRNYSDRESMFSFMDEVHSRCGGITLLIEGGASGADFLARQWAVLRRISLKSFPADWKTHGKAAGPIRNSEMLKLMPDFVVEFPGGRGTADMVRKSLDAGLVVISQSDPCESLFEIRRKPAAGT